MPSFFSKFTSIYTDKSINGWVRGVAWVGTAAAIYIVGHTAYKAVFKSQAEKDAAAAAGILNDSIDSHVKAGIKQSFATPAYTQYADTIYNALGNVLGDQYSTAVSVLTAMKNDLDVELLIKAFDVRPPHTKLQSYFTSPLGLFAFVNSYFDGRWYGLWNQDKNTVNKDWASKGITYQL
jgi:hypothetical protein